MSELYPLTVEQLAGAIANAQAESVETVKIQLFDKTYDLSHAQIIPFRTHSDLVLFASHGVMLTKKVCPIKPALGGKREDAGRPKILEKRKILAIRRIVKSWKEKVKPYRELSSNKQCAYSMVIRLLDAIEKADKEFLLETELQALLEGGFYG